MYLFTFVVFFKSVKKGGVVVCHVADFALLPL